MEMPKLTNSFKGGMNKDISPNEYPNTCYFNAENFRVIVDNGDGLSSASLASPKGNIVSFTLPVDHVYLGSTVLREKLILLTKDTSVGITLPDKIYVLTLSDVLVGSYIITGADLIYEQDLGFDINYPIKVVGNYENAEVQKIYWVDGLNPLKHLNIVSSAFNDLSILSPELLNILPNHTYGSYTLTELSGGHLKAGRIQYSYQLYSVSGTETMFAPPSKLYNLTSSDISDGIDFEGEEIETEINKSIRVTIDLDADVTSTFNRIRLVALEYETYGDVPTVRVIAELELGTNSISFIDSGNTIGEFILEEFQQIRNEITPTTIETKNNYLFAANISQEFFDIDDLVKEITSDDNSFLDTRVYRWRYVESGFGEGSGSQILNDNTDPGAILNTPGYLAGGTIPTNSFDTTIFQATNTTWRLRVTIRPDLHAAAQVPVRTVTGISSINGIWCYVRLRTTSTGMWDEHAFMLDLRTAYIEEYNSTSNFVSIRGTDYFGIKPQDLTPPWSSTAYSVDAVTQFSYTYTYTYPLALGTSNFESTINKVNLLGESPGVWSEIVIDDGSSAPSYDSVPEKHDCINTYNNISNDSNVNHLYKYKYGASDPPIVTDLGGTGQFISYEFITHTMEDVATRRTLAGSATNNYLLDSLVLTQSYANPQTVMDYTSYQRNEVYRFAIVFYDLKGRPSFSKWIADVRFPDINEYLSDGRYSDAFNFTSLDATNPDEVMNGVALGIKFIINWASIDSTYPGLLEQLSGFQIVRTPRTELDCTIKAQGLIVPTHIVTTDSDPELKEGNYSSYNITSAGDYEVGVVTQITDVTGTNSTLDDELVELLSPELVINKDLSIDTSNDFLEAIGHISNITADRIVIPVVDQKSYTVTSTTITSFERDPNDLTSDFRQTIDDAIISFPEAKVPTTRAIGGTFYTPRGYDDDLAGSNPEMTYKGTSLVAKLDAPFVSVTPADYIAGDEQAIYGRYRKPLGYSIYGGATYTERSYSKYIDVSGFSEITNVITSYDLYNGDTYIVPFNFLKLFYDYKAEYAEDDGENSGQVLVAFPTESRINLHYKLDNIPKYFTIPELTPEYYLAEQYSIGISQYPNGYPNINDLYRYNSAYSAIDMSKVFSPKPFDYRSVTLNDVMVTSSEKKYNGEYSDSWLKFKFNNYLELEGEYGAITRLINNNERLVAFQPRAIAVLSVLERELVETNNVANLAVGSGGILSRYDYITKMAGTSLYYAIVNTESGLYFYDDKNIIVYRILEGLEPISDTKGMKSYFESNPYSSLIAAYDRANREVVFSPNASYTNPTICFSGYIDAFSSFYSWNSGADYVTDFITFDKYLLSSLDRRTFYLHNVGNYNEFYGEDKASSLTLISNPLKNNVVTFHTVDWLTDLTISGVDDLTHTFDTLQITNTHQDTGNMILSARDDLRRRFRKWRLNTFRDVDDEGRIRDSWIKSHFTWSQDVNNKKLIVHPIDFYYLPTKIR